MKVQQMLNELAEAAAQVGLRVRTEAGRFRGGRCVVNGEQQIVLNKRQPPEVQFAILAESLREAPLEAVYLKPAVRRALDEAWAQRAALQAAHEGAEADVADGD